VCRSRGTERSERLTEGSSAVAAPSPFRPSMRTGAATVRSPGPCGACLRTRKPCPRRAGRLRPPERSRPGARGRGLASSYLAERSRGPIGCALGGKSRARIGDSAAGGGYRPTNR
jgi:hypothetical protein